MDPNRYWIAADPADAGFLREVVGVDIGPYDFKNREFSPCSINEKAFNKLDPLWGRFVWGPLQ